MQYSWEWRFQPHMLKRGKLYYEEGRVKIIERNSTHIFGKVMGNAPYTVFVNQEEGNVRYMGCNCPYAQDHRSCKHMAALLYAAEEGEYVPIEGAISWTDALTQLPTVMLHIMLKEQSAKNPLIARRIRLLHTITHENVENLQWVEALEELLLMEEGQNGFVCAWEAQDCIDRIVGYMDAVIQARKGADEPTTLMEIAEWFLVIANELNFESVDVFEEILPYCFVQWKSIYQRSSPIQQEQLWEWLQGRHRLWQKMYWDEELVEFFREIREL